MAIDFATQVNSLKRFKRDFILSPKQWNLLKKCKKLAWNEVKFSEKNKHIVPKERGIYCFIIKSEASILPPHGYIAYIGITGDTSVHRHLRVRYAEYLREQKRPKRPLVNMMLNTWKNDIYFYYTVIDDMTIKLTEIETNLLDSIIPPFNQDDFSADIGKVVKAAWR